MHTNETLYSQLLAELASKILAGALANPDASCLVNMMADTLLSYEELALQSAKRIIDAANKLTPA